ncbi:MAG: metallophosphoesterase, partial [Gloeobacteraceae cyanobacterium ES-bin-144]|nr:metallophosphoesterase [Verrucomicrobiales bacterium]
MNRFLIPSTLAALLAMASFSNAQVSYTGGVYSQNFDTLQGTTNNTTGVAWTNNSTLPGWYSSHTSYGVTNGTIGGTAATFDGTATAVNVGLFSFGTASSTDRALGSRATSQVANNSNIYYGVRLVNNTSQTITSFSVTFTGEQWHKNGATTAHTLPVQYQLGATSISTGSWTSVATFTSPVNTATIASLDGNAAANRRGVSGKISGISWAPGAELWVRVADGNESGSEQAMGIDDFYFIADNESGLAFNGSSSYVSMGFGATVASLNTSSFTVECRFMRTGPGVTASTGSGGITTAIPLVAKGVGQGDDSNLDANYFLGIDNSTGRLCADFEQFNATNNGTAYPAGQNFPVYGSTVLQNGVFYHVAATYDTATAIWKLYVNGVAETTTQTLPTFVGVVPRPDNIQGLGLGTTVNSLGDRAGFFHGIIDEARIWNYARSATEINANKDAEIASATGLLGRYGLDEGTGTTAAGTNASGGAAPVGTLAGTVLPVWVNSKTLVANTLPTVALTAPANNSSVVFPASVNLTATAADTDGSVTKVEFFQGTTKLGEDLTGPSYDFTWSGAAVGSYSLTAVATDNAGGTTTSTAVNFTVSPNPNQAPVVTQATPADNATGIGTSTTLSVNLTDNENDAQTVTFYGRKTTPTVPGADFSVGTLPDTQFYSEGGVNGNGRGPTFAAQTQWYLDNRNSVDMPNLAFISHMGDIVEHGDATPNEWLTADAAMKVIENPATSLRPYGIAYGVTPGNHDFGTGGGTGTTTGYNQYFGIPRFLGRNYYGGGYAGNNLSSYQLFRASGLDFISISLEYNVGAKTTYQAQLDWADDLLKDYPNHRGIVTTHWMIDTGNPAAFSTQGANIYNDLKDNPNLFLMLGGHVAGEGRRTDTFEGRTVHSVLQDYQGRVNGGDGWLRYFVFSPANNTITAKTYRVSNPLNPTAGTLETDADSQFTLSYPMQSAVTAWIPLGTVNVPANGTTASVNWTGLEKGANYEWYAASNDGFNTTNSSTRRFTTTENQSAVVSLTAPANNASFTAPAAFTLTADATDADGGITKVEFYQGATKLGEDSSSPYEFAVSGLPLGNYAYTAIARDVDVAASVSSVVSVTVLASQPPTVALTSPMQGDAFDAPASITVTADAQDADGSIALVEFFSGAVKIGEDNSFPYSITWSGVITGSYSLTARATDNSASTTTSSAVTISVTNADNAAPSVALTAPANNSMIAAGNSVNLTASASDTDGTISKIEFFQGPTKLGEDLTAPYNFTSGSLAFGSYIFTARATDNDGGVTTSANANVQAVGSTENTTIARGAAWKYFDQGTDQGTAWRVFSFNDSTWATGNAELGYADSPVTTLRQGPDSPTTSVTKFITYYFRKQFSIVDASQVVGLRMNLLRDDGAVVYLNGTEVARSNMNAGVVNYLTNSATTVGGTDETTYYPINLPFSSLVTGDNVIAVEIHQRDNASSDLSFDMDLITTTLGGNVLPAAEITAPITGSSVVIGTAIPISA